MNWLSSIENGITALSAIGSAVILLMTFRSVNAQTEISRTQAEIAQRQFEIAMRRLEEADVTATPGGFAPFSEKDGHGYLSIALNNCGAIPVRKLNLKVILASTKAMLMRLGPVSISPGQSEELRGLMFISPMLSPIEAEIICEFESSNGGKFRKTDRWNLSHFKERPHELLSSSSVEPNSES